MDPNGQDPSLDNPVPLTFAVRVRDTSFSVLADPISPEVDVIFVHGFTGHPQRTWTCTVNENLDGERPAKSRRLWGYGPLTKTTEAKEVFWPQDLLPTVLPKARIMTYGYDSNIQHQSRRRSNPKRPLIFAAHSLGGIVTKECLRKSEGCRMFQKHLYNIYDSVSGIIFFGTPHRGADPQSLIRNVSESIIRLAGFAINDSIIESLIPSSERLTELREEFGKMAHTKSWTIHSFQEQYGVMALNDKKVVEDVSSSLDDFAIETKQHIAGDHMQMCRFKANDDPEFEKVVSAFEHLIQKSSPQFVGSTEVVNSVASSEQRQACLKSLLFDQIDLRLMNISRAHSNTCKWLLKEPEYKNWLDSSKIDDHRGFLWIKGNPGVGKSTLMKYTYLHLKQRFKNSIITSYFFDARGTALEKTTIGMYRSLASQLVRGVPQLFDYLHPIFLTTPRGNDGQVEWNIPTIQGFLLEAIRGSTRLHFIFLIDALDESPEDEIREMVEFLEELSQEALNYRTVVNICLSSRKFPHITIKNGETFAIDERKGHEEDIAKYVSNRLKAGSNGKRIEEIKSEITERASGVFLWVVLVVQSLNKAFDHGKLEAVQDRLREIPNELHELFEDMLKRDTENMEDLVLLLQWVLFARRPLQPVELYFAIMSLEDSTVLQPWVSDPERDQAIERSILCCSKGLVQISKAKDHNVQFIHESVRDFLLDGGLASLDSTLSSNLIGASHDRLKQCCYRYLSADTLQRESVFDDLPVAKSSDARDLRIRVSLKFPLLDYVIQQMFEHAEAGEDKNISQQPFISTVLQKDCALLNTWIAYNNVFEKYHIRRYPPKARILYILADKGLSSLVNTTLRIESVRATDIGDERYKYALQAAIAKDHCKVIETILNSGDDSCFNSTAYANLIPITSDRPELMRLFKEYFDFNVRDRQGPSLLKFMASKGRRDWCESLLDNGADPEARDRYGATPLHSAAIHGHELVIKLLLEKGADPEARDRYRMTPLRSAAIHGHELVVKLLLEKGANIKAKMSNGMTPLHSAAIHGHELVAKLLLEKGANIKVNMNYGTTPLHSAVIHGYEPVINLLLEKGADIEANLSNGGTALHMASLHNQKKIVKFLLVKGAHIEAKDTNGLTALHCAAQKGYKEIVHVLLEEGFNIEAKDTNGLTALHRAARNGHRTIVKLLLEKGAAYEVKTTYGWTALHSAASFGHEVVVKLLLEKGVDIETKDGHGKTALHWASTKGEQAAVKLILEHEVDIKAKDKDGRTALHMAARQGKEAVVKLLLEYEVDIEAKDRDGCTALRLAEQEGYEAIARLLTAREGPMLT
ncbi:MAG: hypothetical protein M1814_001054 [Vezdaea aestivalis]|nr:MAG: hypothetical protein M1814_001054 [Vezdaea aestivalis]